MIKSVTVTNHIGESIKLVLSRPEPSGLAIGDISGIGPGKATINTTEISTQDGSYYNSARASSRNIVFTIVYLWKNTIEEARHLSYKYFPLKQKVTLKFETDSRVLKTEGYVESNEPTIFSKLEGTSISIICPYPFFYSADGSGIQSTIFSGIEPAFEFPFSNESLEESLLEMGRIQNLSENVVTYTADVETGITIYMHAVGEVRNLTIYNLRTREIMRIDTDKIATYTKGEGIIAGDDIIICTEQGRKSVTLIRAGVTYNILSCVDKDMDWFKLAKGDNQFVYAAEFGATNLQFRVENKLVYEGV